MPQIISKFVQVHVAAIEGETYKFLVLKRSTNLTVYPNLWQVITGTIEKDETAVETAYREIFEETGLTVIKFFNIPFITQFYDVKKDIIQLSPVFGVLVDSNEIVKLSEEHSDYYWLDYKQSIDLLELQSHKAGAKVFYKQILKKRNDNHKNLNNSENENSSNL